MSVSWKKRKQLIRNMVVGLAMTLLWIPALRSEAAWQSSGGGWWYTDNSAKGYSTGFATIGGQKYFFDSRGWMKTGWQWINNTWYYFDGSGVAHQGWVQSGRDWYYTNANGRMCTGWIAVGGKRYFLQSNGVMATGWLKAGNDWFYFTPSGEARQGWVQSGGSWYYTNEYGRMLTKQWITDGGKRYFLGSDGVMVIGWQQISGKWYYFNLSGAAQTGWLYDGGVWYYLEEDSSMRTSQLMEGTKVYTFNSSGALIKTETQKMSSTKPAAPKLINAVSKQISSGRYTITVNWNKVAESVAGYKIYRKEGGGSWIYIGNAAFVDTSYVDSNVSIGKTYTYTVTSYKYDGTQSDYDRIGVSVEIEDTQYKVDIDPSITVTHDRGIYYINDNGKLINCGNGEWSDQKYLKQVLLRDPIFQRFQVSYLSKCHNDKEKLAAIIQYLYDLGVRYDINDSPNSDSVFKAIKGVCWHYTFAAYQLCCVADIPVLAVDSNVENHAWNLVYADGEWLHFDATNQYMSDYDIWGGISGIYYIQGQYDTKLEQIKAAIGNERKYGSILYKYNPQTKELQKSYARDYTDPVLGVVTKAENEAPVKMEF